MNEQTQTAPKLTAEKVTAIFMDCLFKDGEDTTNHIPAKGIIHPVGFHPARLESHKQEIRELLDELPDQFKPSPVGGGGWSFLQACEDKHGNLWGGHIQMEQLFQLGEATELVKCLLPRELWQGLAGGMPYYQVL